VGCTCDEMRLEGYREVCPHCIATKDWRRGPTPVEEKEMAKMSGKTCKRRGCIGGVIRVDNGFHTINCPDCHPSYAEIRAEKSAALAKDRLSALPTDNGR
jgi:hypothetical protein